MVDYRSNGQDGENNGQYYNNYGWREAGGLQEKDRKKKRMIRGLALVLCVAVFSVMVGLATVGFIGIVNYGSGFVDGPGEAAQGKTNSPSLQIIDPVDPNAPQPVAQGAGVDMIETPGLFELSTPDIVDKVKPAVVGVIADMSVQGFLGQSTGTGIVMTADGYIITNQHVIDSSSNVRVVFEEGKEFAAKIVGQDKKSDLAVLKIEAAGLSAAEFGNSDKIRIGEKAVAIGNPMGLELAGSVTQGIISAINRDLTVQDRTMTLIQTDAAINSGNSGGPLIDKFGHVIGINSIKIGSGATSGSSAEGLGFAIPINQAKPIIDSLIAHGYVTERPVIGVTGGNISERNSIYYDIPMGVYVDSVTPGGGAEKAGIQSGDIIVKVNGKVIKTMAELNAEKDKHKAGETLTLTVYRDGKTIEYKVTLTEEKPS